MSSLLTNIADSLLQFSQERRILRVKFSPNAGFAADAVRAFMGTCHE